MADSKFRITVSAVDKTTSVIRGIKSEFASVTSPIRDLKSVFASVGKETGLTEVGKSILDIGSVAASVATKMASVPSLIGGGLSIAGLAEGLGKYAEIGSEIRRTASIIGISTEELQKLRGAAKFANIDAGTLDGGLKSLGTTMESVFFHRAAPETIAAMNQMGISFRKTAKGAPDVGAGIESVADAVQKLNGNAYAQQTLLQSLGISDDMLPFLVKGKEGIRELREEYEKTGGMIKDADIQRAHELESSFVKLGDAIGGVATKSAGWLDKKVGLTDFNNAMADWIGGGKNPFASSGSTGANNAPEYLHKEWSPFKRFLYENRSAFSGRPDVTQENPTVGSFASLPAPATNAIQLPQPKSLAPAPPSPDQLASQGAPESIQISGAAPSMRAVEDNASALAPKMSIELLIKNAPPGMQAQASDAQGNQQPVRIEYGMPMSGP